MFLMAFPFEILGLGVDSPPPVLLGFSHVVVVRGSAPFLLLLASWYRFVRVFCLLCCFRCFVRCLWWYALVSGFCRSLPCEHCLSLLVCWLLRPHCGSVFWCGLVLGGGGNLRCGLEGDPLTGFLRRHFVSRPEGVGCQVC